MFYSFTYSFTTFSAFVTSGGGQCPGSWCVSTLGLDCLAQGARPHETWSELPALMHRCLDALMLLNCNLIEAQPPQVCHGLPQKWPAIEIPHTVDGDVPFADVFAHSLSEPTVANASTSTRNIKKLIEVHCIGWPCQNCWRRPERVLQIFRKASPLKTTQAFVIDLLKVWRPSPSLKLPSVGVISHA